MIKQLYASKKLTILNVIILFCYVGFVMKSTTEILISDQTLNNNDILVEEMSLADKNKVNEGLELDKSTSSDTSILEELDFISRGNDQEDYEERSQSCPSPKRFYHNRIVYPHESSNKNNTDSQKSERLIPKIMHISYSNRCLPQDLYDFMERWEKALPEHSIFLHDDEAVQRLFKRSSYPEFPNLHKVLKCVLYKGAMLIDVWRILVLWLYGGIYTDIDIAPQDSFDEHTIPSDASAFTLSDDYNRPSQWFMAAESHHPWMFDTMRTILFNIYININIKRPQLVKFTGPQVTFSAFKRFNYWTLPGQNEEEMAPANAYKKQVELLSSTTHLTGLYGMKITKIQQEDVDKYVKFKDGFGDIVVHPFNHTMNVTRGERIGIESGMMHWTKTIYKRATYTEMNIPTRCKDYLALIEKDPSKEVKMI